MEDVFWSRVGLCLKEIEDERSEELSMNHFAGFISWQIIKTPLYFSIIKQSQSATENKVATKPAAHRRLQQIRNIFAFFAVIIKFFVSGKKRNGLVLFYTSTSDKLTKNEKGKYFNVLTDAWIAGNIVTNYFYAEQSANGSFKEPSFIKRHLDCDFLNTIAFVYRFLFKRKNLDQIITPLLIVLQKKFEQHQLKAPISKKMLSDIVLGFYGEYKASLLLLRLLKPSLIITSERPGTGLTAGANKLNIPALDLQHGFIDRFHPTYIYSDKMIPYKSRMILPNWIGVFGLLHKELILSNKFWSPDEVVVLGSSRVEQYRKTYSTSENETPGPSILLPTQWTIFKEMEILLKSLAADLDPGINILVKLHPLERKEYVTQYQNLSEITGGRIKIVGGEVDIYPLIKESKIVVGFDSTVLLEAISLGTPSITVGTSVCPDGIHSLLATERLKNAIKIISIDEVSALVHLTKESFENERFYSDWKAQCVINGNALYAPDYLENCRTFIQRLFHNNKAA